MDKKSLLEVLKLANGGNQEAICYFIKKFQLLIRKYARQLNYDCAETDLIIYLLEFIKKMDIEKICKLSEGEIVNYIIRLLRNKKIDIYRKNCLAIEEIHTEEERYIENELEIEDQMDLNQLINTLPDKHRTVIVSKYIYGYSDAEIGTSLGISRQAVNKLKNKALKNLRIQIKEEQNGK
ncbi:MAG: RNA polymerase sigma factor [Aminipila sp.]